MQQFVDAGFGEVALVQIGDTQAEFCEFYARELSSALRALRPPDGDHGPTAPPRGVQVVNNGAGPLARRRGAARGGA